MPRVSDRIVSILEQKLPTLWLNPGVRPVEDVRDALRPGLRELREAETHLDRFAPLLALLFPELTLTGGIIESDVIPVPKFGALVRGRSPVRGRFLVKADHLLPAAGSVKARGGLHAVLCAAERLALENGLLDGPDDDRRKLAGPEAQAFFAGHELSVGSTGNLGLSVGVMGAALGFRVTVHMSQEAKSWKKDRLRCLGATVVEHEDDYTRACAEAREAAKNDPYIHFIDDENSMDLFLGYGVAAFRLKRQFRDLGLAVDPDHPLIVYLPCGVGGGPGGIALGLRLIFGDAVRCFFAEPVERPSMLLGMATGMHADISVRDIGLGGPTEADGLAVSRPSRFVGRLMEGILDGCFTVRDEDLFLTLLSLYETEGLEVEPSAAAVLSGPETLFETRRGQAWLRESGLEDRMDAATHLLWTTGGALLPPKRHKAWRELGRKARTVDLFEAL